MLTKVFLLLLTMQVYCIELVYELWIIRTESIYNYIRRLMRPLSKDDSREGEYAWNLNPLKLTLKIANKQLSHVTY